MTAPQMEEPQAPADALVREIMNLRCNPPFALSADATLAYKIGHRDARHAAAELAGASASVGTAQTHAADEPLTWDRLARHGRVDEMPFRIPGTMRTEVVECVILTRADVDRIARSGTVHAAPQPLKSDQGEAP